MIPLFWRKSEVSLFVNSKPLSVLMDFTVVLNWFSIRKIKAFMVCSELLLQLSNWVHVDLLKSSTIVRKYFWFVCVGVLYGPHRSMWSNLKTLVDCIVFLVGKGILACLSIGQIMQVKGCFGAKETGIVEIAFIFPKDTWPSLACHKWSTFPWDIHDLWKLTRH